MKRKLRIEELSVASFSTEAGALKERGTVLGNAPTTATQVYVSCVQQYTCTPTECCSVVRTCQESCVGTCVVSCDGTCAHTCFEVVCG